MATTPDSVRDIFWPDRRSGKPWVATFTAGHGYFPVRQCKTSAEAVREARSYAAEIGVPHSSETGANDQDP